MKIKTPSIIIAVGGLLTIFFVALVAERLHASSRPEENLCNLTLSVDVVKNDKAKSGYDMVIETRNDTGREVVLPWGPATWSAYSFYVRKPSDNSGADDLKVLYDGSSTTENINPGKTQVVGFDLGEVPYTFSPGTYNVQVARSFASSTWNDTREDYDRQSDCEIKSSVKTFTIE